MTSTLTFQEKFKDRLGTIGKDGIFGLVKRNEYSVNKQMESNHNKKEIMRVGGLKNNFLPFDSGTSSGLFEIKETPIVKKESRRKQNHEEMNLVNNGNYVINNDYKTSPNKSDTPILPKNNVSNIINQTGYSNNSQYNVWNQPSPRMILPFISGETNSFLSHNSNLKTGDLNSLRQNNFQKISSQNNKGKLNGVQPKQFTPVKVMEKINSSSRIDKDVSSILQTNNQSIDQNTTQRSFSTRFTNNLANNLSKIDENNSQISIKSNHKHSNFSYANLRRAGSSEANREQNRIGSSEAYKESIRAGSSEANRNQKITDLNYKNDSRQPYKPYTLKEYKDLGNEKITFGGLGPNVGTKEWEEKANKMKKVNEYSENLKKHKKLVLKPIKEAPIEIIEKIKKEKVLGSNRTKAAIYGKKINKQKEETKNYFSENLLNNYDIKNVYEDNRLDFGEMKEEDEEEVKEFFKDDEIMINNYDFSEELNEMQKKMRI
jgi:hypothetical protein